jgi:phospholipid/cholesterol/gamma-HCH transport system ATP-binding protein
VDTIAIRVSGLRKTFGGQTVLNGIDLSVPRAQTLAVLGKSGTGKSVLLKLLIGLQKADSGSIQINGTEIVKLDIDKLNEVRTKVGFLFQQAALYDSLTIGANVAFPLVRHSGKSEKEIHERVQQLLADVGMDKDIGKRPAEISGGMQKRVGLARALALDPEILLFDEPTAGLDPITAKEISKLFVGLKEKRKLTAVVVTHDIRHAEAFADHVILLNDGKVHAEGSFDDLNNNSDEFVAQFMHDENREVRSCPALFA